MTFAEAAGLLVFDVSVWLLGGENGVWPGRFPMMEDAFAVEDRSSFRPSSLSFAAAAAARFCRLVAKFRDGHNRTRFLSPEKMT